LDNVSKATLSLLASSGDSSSSAPSTIGGNDPNRASCTSNPFQPSSNRNAFGHSKYTDVMLLSCTNNSLQQRISSSDSSSLIGLHCNPECNACVKANSYKVDHRKLETIVPVPVLMKVQVLIPVIPVSQCPTHSNQVPGCLSRLVTFRCQKVMQWQPDLLCIFILAPPILGMSHEEEAQPNALAPDHLQQLWKHSDCYNLQ
jgi:hypothetical protein